MIFGFRFGSVVGKTWVLVRFVLAEFGFLPISKLNNKPWKRLPTNMTHKASSATSVLTDTLKYGLNYLFSLLTRFLLSYIHRPHYGTTEYRGISSRYLPRRKFVGTAQLYQRVIIIAGAEYGAWVVIISENYRHHPTTTENLPKSKLPNTNPKPIPILNINPKPLAL